MKLVNCRIGDYIDPFNQACNNPNLTPWDVSGVNREKEFFEPSRQVGSDTSKYKIVPPGYFACNLMHVGRDKVLPIALNHSSKEKYVSPAYTVFSIIDESVLLKEFFFIYLKSDEKDRYFWFQTDSSIRDGMSWDDFCDVEIQIPEIDIQKKYVKVYKSMDSNQKCYERGLDDLKLTCDAYIEELRRNYQCEEIRDYICETNERNNENLFGVEDVQGVNSTSEFFETKTDTTGLDFHNYKVIHLDEFAYNPSRINLGSIAVRRGGDCIVSPMYVSFRVNDTNKLLPQYLMMWYERKEFQRSTFFYASGSVRDTFGFDVMQEVKIPIPSMDIQRNIVDIYNTYIKRKSINAQLKERINRMCSVLIKGAIEEASV